MLRISKLADYACILMHYLSRHQEGLSAGEIALSTHIHLPTVRKLLKALTKAGLLNASRGVQGGYQLAKPLNELNLLQIVEAIDGPIAMMDCAHPDKHCEMSRHCPNQSNWLSINRVVKDALAHMPLRNI
jgi:FeS assembly SUF system regulator